MEKDKSSKVISFMGVTTDGTSFDTCPFCGADPVVIEQYGKDVEPRFRYEVVCMTQGCVNCFDFAETVEELADTWNRRA